MMRAVEVYVIITVTLMTTLGLPKTCLRYCDLPPENSSDSPVCNCSHQNAANTPIATSKHITTPAQISDSGTNYDPLKPFLSRNTSSDEQTLHMLSNNAILKSKQNTTKDLITAVEPLAEQDNYDENVSKSANQFKTSDTDFQKLIDESKQLPLQLYLDIDINSENNNKPQLEELKKMFKNFQNAEKNLSECINLHIYILSKYIDNINKTNINWGRNVKHDNLSNFQELTEIQSKCDQPANIIKQSIYQINQILSREDQTSEVNQDEEDIVYTTNSYTRSGETTAKEVENVKTSDMNHLKNGNNNNDVTKTVDTIRKTDNVFNKNYSSHNLLDDNDNDISWTSSSYEDSTVYDKINLAATTEPIDNGNPGISSNTDRILISEKDMKIPRITTKELSNGTIVSVVDGYEQVPNSDFILLDKTKSDRDHNVPLTNETISNPDLLNSNSDKTVPSDIVNIHGNLYFSFGKKQIPARFIQQSDGELDVAIDGFSMCDQILEYNTTNFMNSLCKCIIHKNCT
ncbi:hypothetical protein PYW08_000250 [Mythimna loreyi]|uniref:Uncharacterized protein n=1 Tax=Mythimna loreyi TaxID=667449 RepID=A0ACC2RA80_9NEOP|nr:hypothetical protein PYW08_000250 [Mythimna loreyi]